MYEGPEDSTVQRDFSITSHTDVSWSITETEAEWKRMSLFFHEKDPTRELVEVILLGNNKPFDLRKFKRFSEDTVMAVNDRLSQRNYPFRLVVSKDKKVWFEKKF